VEKVLKGKDRREQREFSKLHAHFCFSPRFCNPNSGHEKGGVEGTVGFSRRNFLVPVPRVDSLEALNEQLLRDCLAYGSRCLHGQERTVKELFEEERGSLLAAPSTEFSNWQTVDAKVSAYSTVRVDSNRYSVPNRHAGTKVQVLLSENTGLETLPLIRELHGRCRGNLVLVHELLADRGTVERLFAYVERNFLAGRNFLDPQDLNAQALIWCRDVSNKKHKRSLGMSPEQAYILEKPYLRPLPPYIPPVYVNLSRIVDTEGYVSLETNRYSAQDILIGKTVEVQKHLELVRVYAGQRLVAEHVRVVGKRDVRVTAPGHHAPLLRAKRAKPCAEEGVLTGESEILDHYGGVLKQKSTGRGVLKLRRLLELKRTYPA